VNSQPLNPVTQEHIETYRRDGAVLIRGMLDSDWISKMQAAIHNVIAEPERFGVLGPSHGAMTSVCFMSRRDGAFRDYALHSPIGEVIGRVIGAKAIRLYHDHLFVKPPRSPKIMSWHCDETAWPVIGEMAPNIWTAFSPVNALNGRIEYVAGYHRHCIERGLRFGFRPDQANGLCPDFEQLRNDPQFPFRIVAFDMEPGDAVVFHPHTPHFSKGNDSESVPRIGLAVRVFGDDVRWYPAAYKAAIPGVPHLPEGAAPDGEFFPVIWQRQPDVAPRAAASR
jgi:ectoine hydroxylase-related dioxygenase (phytanoyl-CoA dioxygenase family)